MRILVISLKYLGDVIVATPALRALHEAYPGAHIDVAIRRGYEDALAGNHAVHEIIAIPMDDYAHGSAIARFKAQWRTAQMLRRARYDLVVSFEPGDREALFAWRSGAKRRVGPDYQQLAFLYTDRVPVREGSMNFIDYYCAIAEAAGARVRSRATTIVVPARDAAWARQFLGADQQYVIGIHPGAREADRRWPAERWAMLIDRLSENSNVRVVTMSSPGERERVDAIVAASRRPSAILRANDLTIARTAALMERCHVCVTLDSAPRHIAVAVGTRTVSLLPARSGGPWTLYDETEHRVLFGNNTAGASLVESITVEEVVAALALI